MKFGEANQALFRIETLISPDRFSLSDKGLNAASRRR